MADESLNPSAVDWKAIPLTRGKSTIIDVADAPLIEGRRWHASAFGYAIRFERRRVVWMHREIMNAPKGVSVDHINGDRLDNRRSNLRLATHAENCRNRHVPHGNKATPTGVSFHRASGKWRAYITVNYRQIELGRFSSIEEAVSVRQEAAKRYFGEFAP